MTTSHGAREKIKTRYLGADQTHRPFPRKTEFHANGALELIHGDLCGPITLATAGGNAEKSESKQIQDLRRMNTQKISNIKIPTFDKANYTLWKKKMMLFIRMDNPLYIQILKNGPFTPMVRVEESINGDIVIPAYYAPKDPAEYSEPEKEKVSLDSGL
ncbi:hypothetical protein AgCh_027859 [Apium graveolens]